MLVLTYEQMFKLIPMLDAEDRLRDYSVALMASELVEPDERRRVLWAWEQSAQPPTLSWKEQIGRLVGMVRTAFGGDAVRT